VLAGDSAGGGLALGLAQDGPLAGLPPVALFAGTREIACPDVADVARAPPRPGSTST
jgi:hypothetical protein